MIQKHKKTFIISSLFTLLPVFIGLILRDRLPEVMPTHWGIDGQADGWTNTSTAIFLFPTILLTIHWVLALVSNLDKSNQNKNEKIQKLVYWIIPVLSNFVCCMAYAIALGKDFAPMSSLALMGVLFIFLGNYMPKTKMNATIGIKIPWTYSSEENWNATHRFAGKVWVIGGIALLFSMLLPLKWSIAVMLLSIAVLVLLPIAYSYRYYRMQHAQGVEMKTAPTYYQKGSKVSKIVVPLILAGVALLLFTGDISYTYNEDSFTVDATYHEALTVDYDVIDSVEFREGNVPGIRIFGFASGRLLLGAFENEEFGQYTRYTYTNPKACVVVTAGEKILVLSGKTAEETEAIYENLLVLTENS